MSIPVGRLLGPAEIRGLAERVGLRPTKTLGQNFVHDANTVRRIVSAARLGPADRVLEVGPGLGSLTLALLGACASVTAVEIDPRLAGLLLDTVTAHVPDRADALTVITADALTIGAADLPTSPTALVANLPYNVAVPVLLHLLEQCPTLQRVLVMVQAEVADRLVAAPGSRTYGAPSAKLAWYGRASRAGSVPRAVFWPVPGVDSALVAFDRWEADPEPADGSMAGVVVGSLPDESGTPGAALGTAARDPSRAEVFAVIDAAFAQRRKTLRAALAGWAGSASAAEQACRAAGVDPGARGETLGIRAFAAVAASLERVPQGWR